MVTRTNRGASSQRKWCVLQKYYPIDNNRPLKARLLRERVYATALAWTWSKWTVQFERFIWTWTESGLRSRSIELNQLAVHVHLVQVGIGISLLGRPSLVATRTSRVRLSHVASISVIQPTPDLWNATSALRTGPQDLSTLYLYPRCPQSASAASAVAGTWLQITATASILSLSRQGSVSDIGWCMNWCERAAPTRLDYGSSTTWTVQLNVNHELN